MPYALHPTPYTLHLTPFLNMVFWPRIIPQPALQAYISHYLLLHTDLSAVPAHQRIKPFPPDAEQSLYFYPRSTVHTIVNSTGETRVSAGSIFVGQQTSRINLQFGTDHLVIQVSFHPGYLHQLLGRMPMTSFMYKEIDAELLSDAGIKTLNEELRATADYKTMIALIECYLLKRFARTKLELLPIDRAILLLKASLEPVSLGWLASQACLSPRQFERRFTERMGMSPKYYARIARFHRATQTKLQQPEKDWRSIAYDCGYYDFAHLLRDCREFAEVTPSLLLAEQAASPG